MLTNISLNNNKIPSYNPNLDYNNYNQYISDPFKINDLLGKVITIAYSDSDLLLNMFLGLDLIKFKLYNKPYDKTNFYSANLSVISLENSNFYMNNKLNIDKGLVLSDFFTGSIIIYNKYLNFENINSLVENVMDKNIQIYHNNQEKYLILSKYINDYDTMNIIDPLNNQSLIKNINKSFTLRNKTINLYKKNEFDNCQSYNRDFYFNKINIYSGFAKNNFIINPLLPTVNTINNSPITNNNVSFNINWTNQNITNPFGSVSNINVSLFYDLDSLNSTREDSSFNGGLNRYKCNSDDLLYLWWPLANNTFEYINNSSFNYNNQLVIQPNLDNPSLKFYQNHTSLNTNFSEMANIILRENDFKNDGVFFNISIWIKLNKDCFNDLSSKVPLICYESIKDNNFGSFKIYCLKNDIQIKLYNVYNDKEYKNNYYFPIKDLDLDDGHWHNLFIKFAFPFCGNIRNTSKYGELKNIDSGYHTLLNDVLKVYIDKVQLEFLGIINSFFVLFPQGTNKILLCKEKDNYEYYSKDNDLNIQEFVGEISDLKFYKTSLDSIFLLNNYDNLYSEISNTKKHLINSIIKDTEEKLLGNKFRWYFNYSGSEIYDPTQHLNTKKYKFSRTNSYFNLLNDNSQVIYLNNNQLVSSAKNSKGDEFKTNIFINKDSLDILKVSSATLKNLKLETIRYTYSYPSRLLDQYNWFLDFNSFKKDTYSIKDLILNYFGKQNVNIDDDSETLELSDNINNYNGTNFRKSGFLQSHLIDKLGGIFKFKYYTNTDYPESTFYCGLSTREHAADLSLQQNFNHDNINELLPDYHNLIYFWKFKKINDNTIEITPGINLSNLDDHKNFLESKGYNNNNSDWNDLLKGISMEDKSNLKYGNTSLVDITLLDKYTFSIEFTKHKPKPEEYYNTVKSYNIDPIFTDQFGSRDLYSDGNWNRVHFYINIEEDILIDYDEPIIEPEPEPEPELEPEPLEPEPLEPEPESEFEPEPEPELDFPSVKYYVRKNDPYNLAPFLYSVMNQTVLH